MHFSVVTLDPLAISLQGILNSFFKQIISAIILVTVKYDFLFTFKHKLNGLKFA